MGKKSKRIAELEAEVSTLKRDMELLKAALADRPVSIPYVRTEPNRIDNPPWTVTSSNPNYAIATTGGSALLCYYDPGGSEVIN